MSRLLSNLIVTLRSAAGPGVDRVSDAELLARFVRNRDAAAFELLFWRHGPMIWGVCRRMLGDSADAEDAYQAVFVVLARKADTVGRGEALAGWLHRVARRTALNARTAQRRRSAHERPADLSDRPGPDDPIRQAEGRECREVLDQELLRLPDKFRQPLLLCDLEARSHEEAAAVLDCPLGTLNSRLARGRQKLKERLLRRGVTLTALTVTAAPTAVSAAALDAVLRTPSASVRALADGAIHALTLSAMKKIAVGVLLCAVLFASLAYGAVFAAKAGTTPAIREAAGALSGFVHEAEDRPATAPEIAAEEVVLGKVVDEAGKPVSGATVTAPGVRKSRPVTSGADGGFRLPLGQPPGDWIHVAVLVEDAKDRLGYLLVSGRNPKPVQVVIKPAHEFRVLVTDGSKKPVADAEVGFLASLARMAGGRTDTLGRWTGRVPADVNEWAVFARKDRVGFDYAVSQDYRTAESKPKPLPRQLPLLLDGARTLRVKTVDAAGKPIAGVKVGAWYIQKPDHEGDINLSGMWGFWPTTGKDGTVVLDWLPTRFVQGIPILASSEDFYAIDHATSLEAKKPTKELTINLLPMERLSGRVTHADGRPAAGIRVSLEGQGESHHRFRNWTRTGADGRYTIKVYSEQSYVIAVTDRHWSAPYRGGLVVRAGKPAEAVDFVLSRATRLHGRVTVGKTGAAAAAETQIRVDIDLGEIPKELRRKGDRMHRPVSMYFHAATDKEGRYEFHLGPGTYKLIGPALKETVSITIPATSPPAEIVRDFRMPRPETGPLAGQVVDDAGAPVAGVLVWGRYAADTGAWFREVKTDAQGRFNVKRTLEPLVLYTRTIDRKRAGIARIDADAEKVKIVVGETASATGRLLDLKGKPLPAKKLPYGIRIYLGKTEESPFSDSFGGSATTDAQGRFTLTGLIPGEKYQIGLELTESSWRDIRQHVPKSAGATDLGDLRVDPEPFKPYVPPTPAQRAARAFAPPKDVLPSERKARILAEARREYTRPMLLFGQPKDAACIELYRLFNEEDEGEAKKNVPTPGKLRWEFELASLDTDLPVVRKLAGEMGVAVGKGKPPVLVVLNADGTPAATFPLVLDKKEKLNAAPLTAFLLEHKLTTRDAEKMLADALRKAKTENKRVFFIASASWCGPCRLLSRFLAARKEMLERHYVFVKLDVSRDEHGERVRKRYQGDSDGGVPWYVILDGDGKVLITSNTTEAKRRGKPANIGFPSDEAGIAHFVKMLKETAPRMKAEELAEMRKALAKKP
jgi:RNA polymerase sigma factor (sigma-70 family)